MFFHEILEVFEKIDRKEQEHSDEPIHSSTCFDQEEMAAFLTELKTKSYFKYEAYYNMPDQRFVYILKLDTDHYVFKISQWKFGNVIVDLEWFC